MSEDCQLKKNADHVFLILICYKYEKVTHFRGVRPFGVSLLIAGWDEQEERPYLYQCDPSVSQIVYTSRVRQILVS